MVESPSPAFPAPKSLAPLTLGLEFEFLFGGPPSLISDPTSSPTSSKEDSDYLYNITYILQTRVGERFNITFKSHPSWDSEIDYTSWNVAQENLQIGKAAAKHVEAYYGDEDERWEVYPVELVTPILRMEEIGEWMPILRAIEQCLVTNPGENAEFTGWVNEACGLHVHIAQGESQPLSMQTIQHVIAIYGVFENQIGTLHEAHRRDNDFCSSLWSNTKADTQQDFLDQVYKCGTLTDLARFITPTLDWKNFLQTSIGLHARNSKINIMNLISVLEDTEGKPTIEFREKAGTLDMEDARRWTLFLTELVKFAQQLERQGLVFGIEGELDIKDLLEVLELIPQEFL
ncbi:MAG: hypothetical protein M1835_005856 [Candelina submexicana]|nr:MAG: hypothetical protein M1835_005856 [Candelina submexicana]